MKSLKYYLAFILLSIVSLTSYQVGKQNEFKRVRAEQIESLIEQGYSSEWATHKIDVEFFLIPTDAEYMSIIED